MEMIHRHDSRVVAIISRTIQQSCKSEIYVMDSGEHEEENVKFP